MPKVPITEETKKMLLERETEYVLRMCEAAITKKQNKMKVTVEEKEESEMPVFRVGNVVIRNHPAGSDACWPLLVTEVDWGNNSFKAAVINDLMDLTTTRRVNMSGYKQFHGTITLEVGS